MGSTLHKLLVTALVSSGAVLSVPAQAAAPEPPAVQFHFNEMGSVTSWRAGGDVVVFVKDKAEQWYKAELAETCMTLDTKKGISFLTETDMITKIKTSKVVVDRHICIVTAMTKVASPDAPKP